MKKFCQSCGMPLDLHGQDVRGTEADGSLSEKYCSYCYKDGQYIEPEITFDAMLECGKNAIANGEGSKISKFMMKTFYPMQLKGLERWKK